MPGLFRWVRQKPDFIIKVHDSTLVPSRGNFMDLSEVSNANFQAILDSNELGNTYLKGILQELQASKQQLGFGHSPRPRYIYVNRQYPECVWYF